MSRFFFETSTPIRFGQRHAHVLTVISWSFDRGDRERNWMTWRRTKRNWSFSWRRCFPCEWKQGLLLESESLRISTWITWIGEHREHVWTYSIGLFCAAWICMICMRYVWVLNLRFVGCTRTEPAAIHCDWAAKMVKFVYCRWLWLQPAEVGDESKMVLAGCWPSLPPPGISVRIGDIAIL